MAVYLATSEGLSEAKTGAQNRAALDALRSTVSPGDVIEFDGMFDFTYQSNSTKWPDNLTLRAATPGAVQGLNLVGTAGLHSVSGDFRGMRHGAGLTMQGLTFTASDAPDLDDPTGGNNPPSNDIYYHKATLMSFGSNALIEYCDFSARFKQVLRPDTGSSNLTFRNTRMAGGYYSLYITRASDVLVDTCFFDRAMVDGMKIAERSTTPSNNITVRNSFFFDGRDGFDAAGNWTNILIEDCIFLNQGMVAIDVKTVIEAGLYVINQYMDVNRCRFVNVRNHMASGCNDKGFIATLAEYEAKAPKDITFTDCSYEVNGSSQPGEWINKGGGRFRKVRPTYWGGISQRIYGSDSPGYWPTGYNPGPWDGVGELGIQEWDNGDDSKTVNAGVRAIPTMDLAVGPTEWGGGGTPSNVAPTLSNVVISPNGGPVGETLVVSYTLNLNVFPAPDISIVWKRGGTPISGAEAASYLTTGADEDQTITVDVTATNAEGTDTVTAVGVSITAAPSGPPETPVNTSPPTITGTGVVGDLLAVDPGEWTNSPTSFAYGMNKNDVNASSGQTTYTPTEADVGKAITWGVRATNAAGNSVWIDTEPLVITTAVVGTPTLPASSIPITATVV